MTIRKLILLASVLFFAAAALGALRWNWFGLQSYDLRRDVLSRLCIGFVLFALSNWPAGRWTKWLDVPYGG